MREVLNAFTVDVEDYFQVSAFDHLVRRSSWDDMPSRVEPNTRRLLELLAYQNIRGTFFVLGWVAHKLPKLVREIIAAGHEVACHSYWHRLVYEMTADQFRDDTRQAKAAIEDAAGQAVTAYRAPSFSITKRSPWALDVLVEEGFTVDSSIFPVTHDRYGVPGAKQSIHRIDTASGAIWEFPLAVSRLGKWNLPVSGGGYFRFYPYGLTRRCLKGINRGHQPFAFYVHPWEVDPRQPRVAGARGLSKFRHYVNLSRTERKLKRLVQDFRFGTMSQAIEQLESEPLEFANQKSSPLATASV
jgi:polysaccharide deacetylase family protein (PEP-CTERM system associated)